MGDVPNDGLNHAILPAVYLPYTTMLVLYAQFNIRTVDNPLAYLQRLRTAVASVAADQQISRGASTLEEALESDAQWLRQRLFAVLFAIFSAMALLLALVGLFSVVSFSVSLRIPEFGVRTALGSSRLDILWTAVRVSLWSAAAGIPLGALVDLFSQKILSTWMKSDHVGMTGFKCFPGYFQQQPQLRSETRGLARRHVEEVGVETVHIFEQPPNSGARELGKSGISPK